MQHQYAKYSIRPTGTITLCTKQKSTILKAPIALGYSTFQPTPLPFKGTLTNVEFWSLPMTIAQLYLYPDQQNCQVQPYYLTTTFTL